MLPSCFWYTVDLAVILVHLDQHSDLIVTRLITDHHYLKEVKAPDTTSSITVTAQSRPEDGPSFMDTQIPRLHVLNQRMQVYCAISQKRPVAMAAEAPHHRSKPRYTYVRICK
jgi:hypothetical protein